MRTTNNPAANPRRGKNVPHFDRRALAILILVISLVIAAVWFGHARLETNNNPSVQEFTPKAASH
jgi:hypothetical protein